MPLPLHRALACLGALLATALPAQVSTWIAPGSAQTPAQDWFDPANWDNGVVPNNPAAVAAFPGFTPGQMFSSTPLAGGAPPAFIGNVTLGEVRFLTNLPPPVTVAVPNLFIGQPGGPASSLDLFGPGFTTTSPTNSMLAARVDISNASLNFHNQAGAILNSFVLSFGATLTFADQSSAGPALVGFGTPGTRLIVRDNADISQIRVTGQGLIDLSGATQDVTVTSISGTIDIDLGANRLTLDRLPNNTIAFLNGKITGTGGLAFTTTTNSILVINHPANDYTGDTLIASNPARVVFADGTRVNNVRVLNNALVNIGTTATVTGYLDLAAGRLVLSDNGRAAVLTVQGDYTQGATSTLTVNTSFLPSLVVTGTATLGGRLAPIAIPSPALLGSSRLPLISAGLIVGRFDPFPVGFGPSLTRSLELDYATNEVALVITQLPFANLGTTPSQRAVGASLDANLAGATGSFRNLLLQMNNFSSGSLLAAALGELSPDTYGTLVEAGFAAAAAQQARLGGHFAALRAEGADRGFRVFVEMVDRRDHYDPVAGLWDSDYRTDGGTAGLVWRAGDWAVGASLGREKTAAALDPFGSRVTGTGVASGLFGQHTRGRFFQNASATFTRQSFTLRRRIVFPGLDQFVTAEPRGSRIDLAAHAGWTLARGRWVLTPSVGLLASTWRLDDFAEAGNPAGALALRDWSARSLRARAGLQAGWQSAGGGFRSQIAMAWLHEFEPDRAIPASFVAATTGFISPGRPAETDLVQAGLTFDTRLGRSTAVYVNLGAGWGRNSRITSDLSAGFRWSF